MSASPIRLTIVILAYNEEAYIGQCLSSISAQSVPPNEVIVVNNNSTDRTAEIVATYGFVRLVDESRRGMIYARNRGFDEASSQLIARIDADCQLPPGWVAAVHRVCDKYVGTIAAVSGPAYIYDLPTKFLQAVAADLVINTAYYGISRLMLGHRTLFGSNMVITSEAWQKVKTEVCTDSAEVHEDMDLAIHVACYGTVAYAREMKIGIAKRALEEPAAKTFWRFQIWPKTVTRHRRLFAHYGSRPSTSVRK
jgi:glycosyltransferase involved in cell wall biosynthesis